MGTVDVGILAILPPIIAIVLLWVTRQVVFSLASAFITGVAIYAIAIQGGILAFATGLIGILSESLATQASFIIFLALFGALIGVIRLSGALQAYGMWAAGKIKSRLGASLLIAAVGILTFVDDSFHCLTTGTLMCPIADRQHISRSKLAYMIDTLGAPLCVLIPISTWGLFTVHAFPAQENITSFQLFTKGIPFNFYAILSVFMVFWICIRKNGDFGSMEASEKQARMERMTQADEAETSLVYLQGIPKGSTLDFLLPIISFIICSVLSMLFIGGYGKDGQTIIVAIGSVNLGTALASGTLGALIVTFFLFLLRKRLRVAEFFSGVGEGMRSMTHTIAILVLSWSLALLCINLLSQGAFLTEVLIGAHFAAAFLPVILYLVAALMGFFFGTAWGTFAFVVPITWSICATLSPDMMLVAISAVLAGGVFGVHTSPVANSTILSSKASGCEHMQHVKTQFPYALLVFIISMIGYLIAGFTNAWGYGISLAISGGTSLLLLVIALLVIPSIQQRNRA